MDYYYSVKIEKRKWLYLVVLVALTHLFCQSLMLPYGTALLSLLPNDKNNNNNNNNVILKAGESYNLSSAKTLTVDNPRMARSSNLDNESILVQGVKSATSYNGIRDVDDDNGSMEKGRLEKMNSDVDGDGMVDDFDFVEDETLNNVNKDTEEGFIMQNGTTSKVVVLDDESSKKPLLINSVLEIKSKSDVSFDKIKEISDGEGHHLLGNNFASLKNGSSVMNKAAKKKMKCEMPPKTVTPIGEMQRLLVRHRAHSRAMRPRWSSERDHEILTAKLKIESAPTLKNDGELYAPLFRNVSMFKRSYELMERVLKIYVYKEGEKPIFHQPILKGLYASEGWFMKLMEGNKRFVVKDPKKAHLFYMPFSARMLEYTLYVRNSHNRTNLRQYLKDYSEKIAAKYRFWNRTGGADHFLVACHDWAPYETRHHMEHCIKALCNADVTTGFKIGRDVSFPETYVRSARNPLRDLGGKPPSQRHILAFYAGNMHGYLRPILLHHWKDKDAEMKILGPMPPGVASKMNYIHHMKSSKYCICPKGYEVNSPRIVEAIFYECVPVIISDNFVPPFFEVLNWDAFSVIIAEKDIPNLKTILVSIPERKYLDMQIGVRKVQRHFLWHAKPVKYDLFHMTLHSIWYNRVFQIKLR